MKKIVICLLLIAGFLSLYGQVPLNGVEVLKHANFSQTWRGRFSSDHFPMFAQVVMQ